MAKRKPAGQPASTPTADAAARWQACPFAGSLEAVETALACYRGFVNDIGHTAHGTVIGPPLIRLYDALDRAATEIGGSENIAKSLFPGDTIDDAWNAIGVTD
jgi:hypothetical protein